MTLAQRLAAALLALAAMCPPALAQLPTVAFGLAIGQRLDAPDCARLAAGWALPTSGVCLRALMDTAPLRTPGQGVVSFTPAEAPRHATLIAFRCDPTGALQLLIVSTRGPSVQAALMADLQAKYGAPSSLSMLPLSNAIGARLEGVAAAWASPELAVDFMGATSMTSGLLLIGTPAAVADYHARVRRLDEGGRRL